MVALLPWALRAGAVCSVRLKNRVSWNSRRLSVLASVGAQVEREEHGDKDRAHEEVQMQGDMVQGKDWRWCMMHVGHRVVVRWRDGGGATEAAPLGPCHIMGLSPVLRLCLALILITITTPACFARWRRH